MVSMNTNPFFMSLSFFISLFGENIFEELFEKETLFSSTNDPPPAPKTISSSP
jgi:hypothetical protein